MPAWPAFVTRESFLNPVPLDLSLAFCSSGVDFSSSGYHGFIPSVLSILSLTLQITGLMHAWCPRHFHKLQVRSSQGFFIIITVNEKCLLRPFLSPDQSSVCTGLQTFSETMKPCVWLWCAKVLYHCTTAVKHVTVCIRGLDKPPGYDFDGFYYLLPVLKWRQLLISIPTYARAWQQADYFLFH